MMSHRKGRKSGIFGLAAVVALAAWAAGAAAQEPVLDLPVACRVGADCWLVNFVDRDPGPGRADFRCGALSYDGHKGTDISIGDLGRIRQGVDVLAAADGVVLATRDGMRDTGISGADDTSVEGRECGNGAMIDHGGGWTTQYCHMRRGSLAVEKGSRVSRGQPIGLVGLSGRTEFPHIHITVRHGGTIVDPFSGTSEVAKCDPNARTAGLWSPKARAALAYPGPQPYSAGFSAAVPAKEEARAGGLKARQLPADSPALVFWADIYGLRAGDTVTLRLAQPDGTVVAERSHAIDRPQAIWFGYVGRKRPGTAWPAGIYDGAVVVRRGDADTVKTEKLDVR